MAWVLSGRVVDSAGKAKAPAGALETNYFNTRTHVFVETSKEAQAVSTHLGAMTALSTKRTATERCDLNHVARNGQRQRGGLPPLERQDCSDFDATALHPDTDTTPNVGRQQQKVEAAIAQLQLRYNNTPSELPPADRHELAELIAQRDGTVRYATFAAYFREHVLPRFASGSGGGAAFIDFMHECRTDAVDSSSCGYGHDAEYDAMAQTLADDVFNATRVAPDVVASAVGTTHIAVHASFTKTFDDALDAQVAVLGAELVTELKLNDNAQIRLAAASGILERAVDTLLGRADKSPTGAQMGENMQTLLNTIAFDRAAVDVVEAQLAVEVAELRAQMLRTWDSVEGLEAKVAAAVQGLRQQQSDARGEDVGKLDEQILTRQIEETLKDVAPDESFVAQQVAVQELQTRRNHLRDRYEHAQPASSYRALVCAENHATCTAVAALEHDMFGDAVDRTLPPLSLIHISEPTRPY